MERLERHFLLGQCLVFVESSSCIILAIKILCFILNFPELINFRQNNIVHVHKR